MPAPGAGPVVKQVTAQRYEVVEELGRDPTTQIHRCRLRGIEGFEKDVVVKRVAPRRRTDGALVRHFLDEARLMAKVSHPNIAQVFEVGQGADGPYLVMEYVKGIALPLIAARARRAPQVPYGHMARLIAGICDAVIYAEGLLSAGDDTPFAVELALASIVGSREGVARLLDFGLLRRAARGGSYHRHDHVFIAGKMLFDLTTARREGIDPEVTAVVPSDLVPGYPRELERLLLSTLHARAPDRPTLPQIRDLLEEFATLSRYRSNPRAVAQWLRELFPELEPPPRPTAPDEPTTAITVATGPVATAARRREEPSGETPKQRPRRFGRLIALGAAALVAAGALLMPPVAPAPPARPAPPVAPTEIAVDRAEPAEPGRAAPPPAAAAPPAKALPRSHGSSRAAISAAEDRPRRRGRAAHLPEPVDEPAPLPSANEPAAEGPPAAAAAERRLPPVAPAAAPSVEPPDPSRPRTIPIPTLPRVYLADDPDELTRICRAVESAAVRVAGLDAGFARGATDRLCQAVPAHAPIYPIAMYYFLVREAALGHDAATAATNLEAAHASGIIVRYKDLPGIEAGR
jgi:hypothetical protein